jgi:hypothetical protein
VAQDKVASLQDDLEELEADLAETVVEIQAAWEAKAGDVTTMPVSLERTDVSVAQLVLAWVPVP